jgi:Skp family chaperone for outer membrane proteins
MKLIKKIILLLLIFNSNTVYANKSIVYIDLDFVMNNSLAGKSIQNKLNKINKINIKKFSITEKDLKNEEVKIISQKNILSKDEYKKKTDEFSKKVLSFRQNKQKNINELTKKKIKAQALLINTITPLLADYSKKNDISIIVPKKNIIIGKSDLDITKNILELLDKQIKTINID